MKLYIDTGDRLEVNIPFNEIKKRIKGVLSINVREKVWVRLENEKI